MVSTAGDATLSVADPSATNTGHLVNGAFALPQPLQGLGVVKTYAAPVSNDVATITFKQPIGANDALRTGTYSKTLTFTLQHHDPVGNVGAEARRSRRARRPYCDPPVL